MVLACLCWSSLFATPDEAYGSKIALFALVIVLGMFEKLSAVGNMISMERDWVPALAEDDDAAGYTLTHLNAIMRRIDLTCKLIAPLVISAVITIFSTEIGILVVGSMSLICWGIELWSAKRVWNTYPSLRKAKSSEIDDKANSNLESDSSARSIGSRVSSVQSCISGQTKNLKLYFATSVWIPSISLALLHFSALSYGATFITFLLNNNISVLKISVARAVGSVVEVSSTCVAPLGISYLAYSLRERRQKVADADDEAAPLQSQDIPSEESTFDDQRQAQYHIAGLARCGLWGVTWQLLNLVSANLQRREGFSADNVIEIPVALAINSLVAGPAEASALLTTLLLIFIPLTLSRLGLWIFDLSVQEITQTLVPASKRSSFAGTEMGFVSLFELLQWVAAALVSSSNERFKWLAFTSFGAVAVSSGLFAGWVRRRRGHLLHFDGSGCCKAKA